MTATPEPAWKIEWRGDPSGFPRWVHVFFIGDSAPAEEDMEQAARDLASRLDLAKGQGQFNHAVLTFASHRQLSVRVYDQPSHKYPAAEVITVTFAPEKPMTVNVTE